jgi:endonuclease-3
MIKSIYSMETRKVPMNINERINEIRKIFNKLYSDADCSLEYKDPLQLLVATQLAAQCTDARVNIITKHLFKKYKNVYDYASADISTFEKEIKSAGFYRNKAKNIISCCKMLIDKYDGRVPDNMDDLLKLPGVGRKTANLILGDIFGIPGIVVDTHAKRLSNRIGLTKNTNPDKVEQDLLKIIPADYQTKFCHQLVFHGRAVCTARKPKCDICEIREFCDYGSKAL